MDDNKQFWERFSRHYAGFMRRSQATYQQIYKAMRPFLKRDMDVLELACGTGQLSVPLSPCVRSWEATDFSAEMIRQAKKQVYSSRLHFSVQDATKLPYGPGSFDAVVISNALHVMPHPEKALAEAWRVLKPGGWLFAPTFVWGKSRSARLRLWFMGLSGFRVIFIVTHDFEFVSRTCSRILHFDEGEMPDDVPVTMDALPTLRELFSISESRPGRTEHRKSRFCAADC